MSQQAPAVVHTQQKAAVASSIKGGVLQRKCACGQHTIAGGECAECRQKQEGTLQHAAVSSAPTNGVPTIVHDVLSSSGQPLDAATRAFMEPRFGHDFSGVRVHTDARAAESSRAVNALAYTVGRDVVFGTGQYSPGTSEGRRLMAHELVHTIQQSNLDTIPVNIVSTATDPRTSAEQEAENISLHATLTNAPGQLALPSITKLGTGAIQRQVTKAFTEEQFTPVREAFKENVKKTTKDSCIVIVNKGLRKLFVNQLKGKPLGSEMEKTMARLNALNLADQPMTIEFLDAKGQITKGTRAPDKLSTSAKAAVLGVVGPDPGWYLFGLSIMDGYHSVLLAVDYRIPTAVKIYWMDQIYSGFEEVTNDLDNRISRLTKQWWNDVMKEKKVGYNTIVRIWPIVERLPGDFPAPATTSSKAV